MQPKFTQKNLGYFCTKIIAIALIFSASTQFSFAQKNSAKFAQQKPGYENTLTIVERQKMQQAQQASKPVQQTKNAKGSIGTDNDAGLPNRPQIKYEPNSPMGICTTFVGSLTAGDPTLPGNRFFRDAIPSTCAGKACPGTSAPTGCSYDILTWTNPSASAQCATAVFTVTADPGGLTAPNFVAAYNGAITLNPLCPAANFLGDPGSSPLNPGDAVTFGFTVPGNATVNFLVMSRLAGQFSSYTLTVDVPVGCGAAPPCSWSASTIYPINVLDQANVTVGTTFYSFAGVSANAVIATSYKFDGTVWTPIAPTPQPLEYPAACTDGANIYILGGASSTGVSLNTLYRYNIASNTYTTLAPFVTGVWNPSAVYIGGKIYKFCGTGAAGSVNNLEIYDIAGNSWTNGANYPIAISFVSAIARGGFIYAGGGVQTVGTIASAKTYQYDPVGNSWNDAAIADLPLSRWGAASDFYNNSFVMAGGYLNGAVNITNTATAWDQGTNTWSALPNMIRDEARMGGATFGPAFHVIGGRSTSAGGFVGTNNNQRLFCIPPTPCTGTPAPGNTVSSANPVCSGTPFTLSLQNNPFVSGFTYQWQSAASAAGPWSNLPGGTNITHTLSQTGATWYRCIVGCTPSGLSGTSNPLLVLDGQGVFTSQPVSTSVQCGSCATFSFTATGNSLTYSWEYRTSPGGFWLNVTGAPIAGATVSGQTTNTLTLCNVSAALNGYQFRGLIQGPCTAVDFTNVVTLTVTPYIVNVSPTSATICLGQVQQLCITNTVSGPTTASFTSGPLNFNIPDNIGTASTFTIPVAGIPAGALITNVRIHLNMTHTYPADMVINLKGTHATNILSLYKHNTNTDNGAVSIPTAGFFNAICSQTGATQWKAVPTPYRYGITPPTGPFAADALNGVTNPGYTIMDPIGWVSNAPNFPSLINPAGGGDPNGTWTLAMCDGGPADLGNFTGWTIDIDYTAPVFAQGVWTSSPAAPNTMFNDAAATIPYVAGTPQTCIFVKPSVNTNYTVVVTTATPCVSAPTTVPVTVITPIGGLVPPANRTVCVGTNASFTVGLTGGPFTYSWEVSVNNGLTWSTVAGATSATLNLIAVTQLMNNNLYRVTINGGPCGSTTTAAGRLNVLQLPVVTISSSTLQLVPGRIATITGTSSPAPFSATSWSWTLNGNTIPGATGSIVTANIDQQGSYRATVTDNQVLVPAGPNGGCTNSSNIVTIGSEASGRLWIYPNPNTGQFEVRLYYNGVQAERRIVRIYNMGGQLVAQKEFDLVSGTHPYLSLKFDLGIQSAGTYVVKVVDKHSQQITSGLVVLQ